jgi:RHS repeat-associated protein
LSGIEYDGSTFLFAMTEEGRVRPRSNGTYTYDYFLKDHLGNIHVVLSSDTPSLTNYPTATMETGTAALESTYYANLDATRFAKPTGFDTNTGNLNVARVNSSQQIGPSITLKVNAGDVLNLGVKSFYQSSGSNYNRNTLATTALSQLLTALLSPMALSGTTLAKATDGVNTQAFGNSTNYQTMMGSLPLSNYNSSPSNTPKAYLVWLLFDNEFNLIKTGNSSGMLQVPTSPDQMQTLAQTGITMDKSGFFYAYVVNESSMNVYFDDFQVSTTIGPVLEENNYYPFGLLNAQLSAPGIVNPINKYKYNGKELQNELSLAWLDYGGRYYDPQIGRWHSVDPLAEVSRRWSPYTYGLDNPIRFIDPDGMDPQDSNVGADGLTSEQWMETSSPKANPDLASNYRQQNNDKRNEVNNEKQNEANDPKKNNQSVDEQEPQSVENTGDGGPEKKPAGQGGNQANFTPPMAIPWGAVLGEAIETAGVIAVRALGVISLALTCTGDTKHNDDIQYFYHYTDKAGLAGILSTKCIMPNAKGKVYLTDQAFSPAEAFQNLFLSSPTHANRGDYIISIGLTSSQRASLQYDRTQPFEYIHPGTLRIAPGMIKGFGPNPF